MKIFLGTFVLSLFFLAFSFGETHASKNTPKPLDKLRKDYLTDKAALDQINRTKEKISEKNKDQKIPKSGTPEYKKALEEWLPLWQKEKASYPKYLNALVKAYCELPPTDKKDGELKKEIEEQHPEHSKHSLTVSYYERHSLLANAITPHLYNHDLDKERAKFFVKLLKPSFNTKMEDFLHFFKLPAEPDDWSVQTGYSLANLRAGNLSTARKENKKLVKKATKYSRLDEPEDQFILRKRKQLRAYKLHRALIEAIDGKVKESRKYLTEAMDIASAYSPSNELKKIIDEIKFLLDQSQQ